MKKKIISILLSSAMIFSMGISTVSAAAADDTAATESIVVSKTEGITDTAYGKVRGFIDDGTYTFRGIPYAKADRFEMPEAPDTWDDVRNCLVYGSTAPTVMVRWVAPVMLAAILASELATKVFHLFTI